MHRSPECPSVHEKQPLTRVDGLLEITRKAALRGPALLLECVKSLIRPLLWREWKKERGGATNRITKGKKWREEQGEADIE